MGIATRHISPQIALSAVLFIGLAAIAYHALNDQLLKAFLVVLIPIAIIYIILSIKRPLIALITYGTLCYFWGVIYRTLSESTASAYSWTSECYSFYFARYCIPLIPKTSSGDVLSMWLR